MLFTILLFHFATSSCDDSEELCSQKFISKVISPTMQSEGDGALVRRIIGSAVLDSLDPFLMMDHFYVEPPAGFPDHPHRGFETITYMFNGTCVHEDFLGNKGEIETGDIQWMTAGKGIVHAEMPKGGPMEGLQLWLNLGSTLKMVQPSYQELKSKDIPTFYCEKFTCKIIAGNAFSFKSPILTRTPAYFWDIILFQSQHFSQKIPEGWNTLIYVIEGALQISGKSVSKHQAAVLSAFGSGIDISTEEQSRFIIISGKKLSEKVSKRGPFVMNEPIELNQAIEDYRQAKNGFENASSWKSSLS